MSTDDIARVQGDFVAAAKRASDAGFQWLELHLAHGFLAHSFLSPHSYHRKDGYGGSFKNRARFILETIAAVRAVWPDEYPLSARLSVIEYDGRDEETLAESLMPIAMARRAGLDLVSVSMGFSTPDADIPGGPAFMEPIAGRIRREGGLPVALAWGVGVPGLAEAALRDGQADLIKVGQSLLANRTGPTLRQRRWAWSVRPGPRCRHRTPIGWSATNRPRSSRQSKRSRHEGAGPNRPTLAPPPLASRISGSTLFVRPPVVGSLEVGQRRQHATVELP